MYRPMDKILEQLFSTHILMRRSLIVLIILILGYFDWITGYEYSFSVFYLLPVSIAAWYDNYKVTVLAIFFSGATWLTADMAAGHHYSNMFIPFWNVLVRIGLFSIVATLLSKIRQNWNAMKDLAMKDQLTSLHNIRAFEIKYDLLHQLGERRRMSFGIGLIDLDGFKAVNDTYGHQQGDEVLIEFAKILKQVSRSSDVIARLGGDEFALILLDINETTIQDYEKRLRAAFQASHLKQNYGVDFSMGLVLFNRLPERLKQATHIADELMYQSKALGKSQTTLHCVK